MKGWKNDKGFTLIELLIVVAIIGILAAIAIPGFLGQQKKAKWRSLMSSCEGASKQASTMLSDLARLDPIELLQNPGTRICFAHVDKTMVDTKADGIPDTDACKAKFADKLANDSTYGTAVNPDLTVVTALANGIYAEACGQLAVGTTLEATALTPNPGPFQGLNKTSPYYETRCLYSVQAAPYVVAETEEGECVIEPNDAARTMRFIAIEDDGKAGTVGETMAWTAVSE